MDYIKKTVLTFGLILAGTTISTTLFITLFVPGWEFTIFLLWQIIIVSGVCSLGNLIYYSRGELSKRQMRIRIVLHYLYINAIVLGGAFLWQWIKPGSAVQLLVMLLLIAMVYAVITAWSFKMEEKTARDFNEQLRRLHSGEEEKNE
jgi:hypothetical protein